jgi:hypothetical protein
VQGLDNLAVTEHLQYLRRIHDIDMNIFRRFLMLLTRFLDTRRKESVGAVVMDRRIRRQSD